MLPQRQTLARLGSAYPFHRGIISVPAQIQCSNHARYAVDQIVMRVGRMVDAVLAATGCATLESDDLRENARVIKQVKPSRVDGRQQVSVEV